MQAQVLITGGTGFIGKAFVRRLLVEKRCRIRILCRDLERAKSLFADLSSEITLMEGDLLTSSSLQQATKNVDIVVHLAAEVCFSKCFSVRIHLDGLFPQ